MRIFERKDNMNFKKIIVNSLAVVGAIVIVDKLIEVVTDKTTKIVSEDMLDENFDDEECIECDEENEPCPFEDDSFPEIKKYDNADEGQAFQYTVKAENITSSPAEV